MTQTNTQSIYCSDECTRFLYCLNYKDPLIGLTYSNSDQGKQSKPVSSGQPVACDSNKLNPLHSSELLNDCLSVPWPISKPSIKKYKHFLAMTQIQHQLLCCTQQSPLATAAGDQWPIITIGIVLRHKCTTWESRVKTLLHYWPSAGHLKCSQA